MNDILIQVNEIELEELYRFQVICDQDFVPPISSRVDLREYSRKLHDHSERITVTVDGKLAGLLCIYANDTESKEAFVSSVAVSRQYRSMGLGKILMRNAIDLCRRKDMTSIRLEVAEDNLPAIRLYTGFGFRIENREGMTYTMVRRHAE